VKRTFLRTCAVVSALMAGIFGAVSDLHAQVNGRAFGIEGQVQVLLPIVNISPQPVVTLPPGGGTQTDSINNFSGVDPVLSGILTSGTVTVRTTIEQNPSGTPIPINSGIYSFSRVENLSIGGVGGLLPGILTAQTITATCTNGPAGLVGSTEFTGTTILGVPLNVPPPPNTVIPVTLGVLGTVGRLTLNGQAAAPSATSRISRGLEPSQRADHGRHPAGHQPPVRGDHRVGWRQSGRHRGRTRDVQQRRRPRLERRYQRRRDEDPVASRYQTDR
jgi:hypothetical protein